MSPSEINAEMLECLKMIEGTLFGKSTPTNLDRILLREIRAVIQKAEPETKASGAV